MACRAIKHHLDPSMGCEECTLHCGVGLSISLTMDVALVGVGGLHTALRCDFPIVPDIGYGLWKPVV
jgi:hypothetical protein